jgi:serine/threonine-protein kinase
MNLEPIVPGSEAFSPDPSSQLDDERSGSTEAALRPTVLVGSGEAEVEPRGASADAASPALNDPAPRAASNEGCLASRAYSRVASTGELDVPPRSDRVGPYQTGDTIAGKYQLVRVLCQGGMGSVWIAYNQALDVQVALKLIRPDVKGALMTERLMTEARLAARLEHPAIIGVHDLGNTDRGDPYLVMELLHGGDLRSLLEAEGRLSAERAVALLLPIAEGLAFAHAKGVVHRDLKPENVFLARIDDRLQPKVLDFGIAKPALAPGQRRITRAGAVVGSPDYMSPEQARGIDVDHRADVWAYCAVVYECVTGRAPFADSAYDALLKDIVDKPVTSFMDLGIEEPELWNLLQRGFSKNRDDRYPNMRELGRELAQWLRNRGVEEDVCGHSLRAAWLRPSHPELASSDPRGELGRKASPAPMLCDPIAPAPAARVSSEPAVCQRGSVPEQAPASWYPPPVPKRRYAAQLRVAVMVTCSALIGAGAVNLSPKAVGAAAMPLRTGAAAASAALAARHNDTLRTRLTAPAPTADEERQERAATPARVSAQRTAAVPRSVPTVASVPVRPIAPSTSRAVRSATWPFTSTGRGSLAPVDKTPPRQAVDVRGTKAKHDPDFGF